MQLCCHLHKDASIPFTCSACHRLRPPHRQLSDGFDAARPAFGASSLNCLTNDTRWNKTLQRVVSTVQYVGTNLHAWEFTYKGLKGTSFTITPVQSVRRFNKVLNIDVTHSTCETQKHRNWVCWPSTHVQMPMELLAETSSPQLHQHGGPRGLCKRHFHTWNKSCHYGASCSKESSNEAD